MGNQGRERLGGGKGKKPDRKGRARTARARTKRNPALVPTAPQEGPLPTNPRTWKRALSGFCRPNRLLIDDCMHQEEQDSDKRAGGPNV